MFKRRKIKRFQVIMLSMMLFIMSFCVVNAKETEKRIFFNENAIEAQGIDGLEELLEEYSILREKEFFLDNKDEICDKLEEIAVADSAMFTDELNRIDGLQNVILYGINVKNIDNTFTVLTAELLTDVEQIDDNIVCTISEDKEYLELEIYEWTELEYFFGDSSNIFEIDFETRHYILVEKTEDALKIASDRYEERTISGVVTEEYRDPDVEEIDAVNFNTGVSACELLEEISILNGLQALRNMKNSKMRLAVDTTSYDVASAIAYANKWTEAAKEDEEYYTDSYNPYYYYYYKNDCCNFVSQCLHAGGFDFDGDWSCTLNTSGILTQDKWTSNGYQYSKNAWRSTGAFSTYWEGEGYKLVKLTESNYKTEMFPGNPIYYEYIKDDGSTGRHIGICTGYVDGDPILNAHTSNRIGARCINWINGTNIGTYTIKINTSKSYTPNDVPNQYTDIGTVSSSYNYTGSLADGEEKYFYFSVPNARFYDIYTTGSLDTYGEIFVVSDETLYPWFTDTLHLGDYDDDGGYSGQNFALYDYLEPGITYCVKVTSYGGSASYRLTIE